MDAQHIIEEARKLPVDEQRNLVEALTVSINQTNVSEEERHEREVLEMLSAKGVISEIVAPMTDAEDDEFPPIEIGANLSRR